MTDTEPDPKRAAPLSLWRTMRVVLCLLFDMFGSPADIAERLLLPRRTHALMLPWLRAAEAFLRRLLYIEALALIPDLRAAPASRAPRPRRRRFIEVFPDRPEGWPVHFRAFAAQPRGRKSRAARTRQAPMSLPSWVRAAPPQRRGALPPAPPSAPAPRRAFKLGAHLRSAWPVAERYEAMLRVFNDPQPAARRLAYALRARAFDAARLITPQPQSIANLIGPQSFARCEAIVARRRRLWQSARPDSS